MERNVLLSLRWLQGLKVTSMEEMFIRVVCDVKPKFFINL